MAANLGEAIGFSSASISTSDSSSEGEDEAVDAEEEEEDAESTIESTSSRSKESSTFLRFICLACGGCGDDVLRVVVVLDESSAIKLAMVKERLGLAAATAALEGEGNCII